MKQNILFILALVFLISCGSENHYDYAVAMEASDDYAVPMDEITDDETMDPEEGIERKIIKNGILELEVRDLGTEKRILDTLVRSVRGYYEREELSNTSRRTSFYLKIRIPSAHFEQFIAAIERGGNEITSKSIEAEDVTEEYIDLETRLANKRSYMARYQELLKSARSVQDILEIQERIRKLEEEVESTMGRIKYLSHQVSYSTLYLTMHQPKEFVYQPGQRAKVSEKMKQSVIGGWHEFIDFLYILLYNWVLILFITAGVTFWLVRRRRRRAGKGSKE